MQNLENEVKEMVKAIYVKTYGEKPNFAEGETYYLDMSDVSHKKVCKIYVDIYNTIDESEITEKQKIEYIQIDNDGDIEFETESGYVNVGDIGSLMNIYSFLYIVMGEIGLNADSRTAYVDWDINDIPTEVEIPFYVKDDEIEDYLSNTYGCRVESYTIDNE
jgi:hypothetical protein